MPKIVNQLESLNRLAQTLSSTENLEEIINAIIKVATELTAARRGSILFTKNQAQAMLTTLIRVGTDRQQALLQKMSMMVAGWILKNKESLLSEDIAQDHRFKGLQMLDLPRQSIVAVPIRARGQILGVLILNNDENDPVFQIDDLQLANIISSQSAHVLENAELLMQLKDENKRLKQEVAAKYSFDEIIGRSPAMDGVFKLLDKVIPTQTRVLIQGNSGTGKELIARAIHYHGSRKEKPFIAVDCGALPENLLESELFGHVRGAFTGAIDTTKGLFQVADGGTLFLDEINNTTPALQAKLLRVIQEGEIRAVGSTQTIKVDVRLIFATSIDLGRAVREGSFREDLYFRLKVVPIVLPPLNQRPEDILVLANHFLKKFSQMVNKPLKGFSRDAAQRMLRYDWPGNVRELEHTVERATILAEETESIIPVDLLPDEMRGEAGLRLPDFQGKTLQATVEALERSMIAEALKKFNGNKTRAAKHLGLSRRGIFNKIERYRLKV